MPGYVDQTNQILLSDFPVWFNRYVRGWAYQRYMKGKKLADFPERAEHELYAEHVGVKSHIIYNLMQYPTENIPSEVLMDLGLCVSSVLVAIEKPERVTCLNKINYKDKE